MAAGVFSQSDAHDFVLLAATGTDAQVQYKINGLRLRFQVRLTLLEDRKSFVYLLARLVKSFHFLTCFFSFPDNIKEFVTFAEYVGPQLIKQGSVSELMKQIRQTEVIKAAVEYQGEVKSTGGKVKLRPGGGNKGAGPPIVKVSVQDMIDDIRKKYAITDEEALYIRQVTEAKVEDPAIRDTVQDHREDKIFLETAYRGQVNGEIRVTYNDLGRYDELADAKYTDTGGIFDSMAITVINTNLMAA
jgi:type I restriction enzyme, R subunit